MPNLFGLSGAQAQKATRSAPIYTGRWSSGLWTNRSPLRDANTTRLVEKFYGPSGDALIDGANVEITNRLTLARRPGNPAFSGYTTPLAAGVNRFEEFRLFTPTTEHIKLVIDQANSLSAIDGGVKSLVWTKSTGAGQTNMQSVGNTLYFGNGVDNKKWLQTLNTWTAGAQWGTATTPFLSTFIIDTNGNLQQLTATALPITSIQVAANVVTVTCGVDITQVVTVGAKIEFPQNMAATFMAGQTGTILSISGSTFTIAALRQTSYGPTSENVYAGIVQGGTPISGSVQPTWSTTPLVPGISDPTQAVTYDGTVQWTNRGTAVKNWGIQPPTSAPVPALSGYRFAWAKNTYYSTPAVIVDSNGNLQEVTTAGITGGTAPAWASTLGVATQDGTAVWTVVDTAVPNGNPATATPTFAPVAGTYTGTQSVVISCSTPSSTIYYTTDGSIPDVTSAVYSSAISVTTSETINAIATAPSHTQSAVGSATYSITGTQCAPVSFSPVAGTYTSTQTVTLICPTASSTIYYTLDGSAPTLSSPVYSGPLTITQTTTVTAMATAPSFTQSATTSATYVIGSSGGAAGGGTYGGTTGTTDSGTGNHKGIV